MMMMMIGGKQLYLHADSLLQVSVCDGHASLQPIESLDQSPHLPEFQLAPRQLWERQDNKKLTH